MNSGYLDSFHARGIADSNIAAHVISAILYKYNIQSVELTQYDFDIVMPFMLREELTDNTYNFRLVRRTPL